MVSSIRSQSNKENGPRGNRTLPEIGLARMFADGSRAIATHRCAVSPCHVVFVAGMMLQRSKELALA